MERRIKFWLFGWRCSRSCSKTHTHNKMNEKNEKRGEINRFGFVQFCCHMPLWHSNLHTLTTRKTIKLKLPRSYRISRTQMSGPAQPMLEVTVSVVETVAATKFIGRLNEISLAYKIRLFWCVLCLFLFICCMPYFHFVVNSHWVKFVHDIVNKLNSVFMITEHIDMERGGNFLIIITQKLTLKRFQGWTCAWHGTSW